jgi:hypothetical protein
MNEMLIYIDPGSGSILAQVIIGAILSVVYFFKNIRNYIKSIFSRTKNENNKLN